MNVIYLGNHERKHELTVEFKRAISTLQKNPAVEKIILFGSLANGLISMKSDLDLLIIKKTNKPFLTRAMEIMQLLNPGIAIDILVYTPEEFAEMQEKPNSFIKNILENGRIVYEKKLN